MGKQVNYYMDFNDFLTLAKTALDCGCLAYKQVMSDGKVKIIGGKTMDMFTPDHSNYYFQVPGTGGMDIDECFETEDISMIMSPDLIQAGFSVPIFSKLELYRNRIYVSSGAYDQNGIWIPRPEIVTKVYDKLAGSAKKIAPYTEFEHYVVNSMFEGKLFKTRTYISPSILELVVKNNFKLG
ncbi:MAG: hypothetical protein IKW96_02530 [Ruminococcus sp.]|uniref:hypothetical protein n=1 Tax=Ruminococcus sp. TaxID=41978 RepID=UPI0025DAAF7D|nr:hypothetical protein [Ruminococcus sp.]MBR5682148.1 hypothetical protein [Ruminococcus sp.]